MRNEQLVNKIEKASSLLYTMELTAQGLNSGGSIDGEHLANVIGIARNYLEDALSLLEA